MYAYNYNIENAEGFDEDFFNKIYNELYWKMNKIRDI